MNSSPHNALVDVIIPVFEGYAEVVACVTAVLHGKNEILGDVLVVNDASPNERIVEWLQARADDSRITLLCNEQNLGFVDSVNLAAEQNAQRDFVILNSDTCAAGNWLDRLARHGRSAPDVATVTPFSNNGEIVSFPVMGVDNPWQASTDVDAVDAVFAQANSEESVELPTGVGFCMFVKREAWTLTGGFDRAYGRGYGEEVDLCCALTVADWRHLLATDVFVYHAGGVSFGSDTRARKETAQALVDERYPDFAARVQQWIASDPAAPYRQSVEAARLAARSGPRLLFVSHAMGGGVQAHLEHLARLVTEHKNAAVFLLSPTEKYGMQLRWLDSLTAVKTTFAVDAEDEVIALLKDIGFQRIHFHHLAGCPPWVYALPQTLDLPFDVTVHDFYALCPPLYAPAFAHRLGRAQSLEEWKRQLDPLLSEAERSRIADYDVLIADADRVICPSEFVAQKVAEHHAARAMTVLPHPEVLDHDVDALAEASVGRLKVGLLGSLSPIKGLHFVKELASLSQHSPQPADFVIIGPTTDSLGRTLPENISVLGHYRPQELPALLKRERLDAFLFYSTVPETYSYTLTTAMTSALPIVAVADGAIAERLTGVDGAEVLPLGSEPPEVLAALMALPRAYAATPVRAPSQPALISESDYLATYVQAHQQTADWPQGQAAALIEGLANRPPEHELAGRDVSRSMAELLPAALECKKNDALEQLRRQALGNESELLQHRAHLAASLAEVEQLKHSITDLKQAGKRDVDHLKGVVAALKAAHDDDSARLKSRIDEVLALATQRGADLKAADERERALQDTVAAWTAEHARLEAYLAEREGLIVHLADQLSEITNSRSWRAVTALRKAWHTVLSPFRRLIASLRRLRRLSTFLRYHYAVGGASGVRAAIHRRLSSGAARAYAVPLSRHQQSAPNAVAMAHETGPIHLATSEQPEISIVIPTYGSHDVTLGCLRSIARHPPQAPFEVVIVDDAYEQPLTDALGDVDGVRLLRNIDNLGFLRTCNEAVAQARGAYVLLLNNDTLVHEGAIDSLRHTFDRYPRAGAVGAKLLFADGVLQEAGGIVWRDGSAWNWGRNEDAEDPRFNYVREADYCSAAALMLPTSFWHELNGFDEAYLPAYYEDTDLCFRVREMGRTVLYQPAAVVTHLEGVSHGTDEQAGLKAHQVRNQSTFVDRWEATLGGHEPNGHNPLLERDRGAKGRIMWVEALLLTPDQDSGSLRTFRLLKILVELGFKVTYVPDNLHRLEPYTKELQQEGIEVVYAPQIMSVADYIKQTAGQFDVITLCRHYIAINYVDLIRQSCPDTVIWFDTIDLHYLRLRRQYDLEKKGAIKERAQLAYDEELAVIEKSDITIVVSDVEVAELAKEAPQADVRVVSNIHELDPTPASVTGRNDVMFVGGYQHPPNVDAVEFYAKEIWPKFREQQPDAETFIIGSKMPDSLKALGERHGLTMVGYVDDLTPYYRQCRLSIAPLRYGAGVKGKVNQALSFGLPVVGTSAAVEGMGLTHGQEAMIADEPDAFVAAMLEAYTDADLWATLSERGKASVAATFSTDVARQELTAMLADMLKK